MFPVCAVVNLRAVLLYSALSWAPGAPRGPSGPVFQNISTTFKKDIQYIEYMLLCYELKFELSNLIASFPDFLLPLILKYFSNPLVWVLRSLALSVSLV